MTYKAKEVIGLDFGALDFVEGKDGFTVFELNDAPDLNPQQIGIQDNTWSKVAALLMDKIKK